ncbi:hypothetical protein ABBQ38_002232 [Trebouxia sp. C0009 RCD-2024]
MALSIFHGLDGKKHVAKYDAVMANCLSKGEVLFTTLMTDFVSIHLGDLERYDLHFQVVQQSAAACALGTAGMDSTKGAVSALSAVRSKAGLEESENQ